MIALVITLLNNSPNVDENNIFNDNPHPEASTPKKAPGIVRIPPTIVQIVSAPTSFVQLSIRIAMMPTVVISVPICFYVLIYTQKAQTFVVCLYSVSKDFLDEPQQSKYFYGKAHAYA